MFIRLGADAFGPFLLINIRMALAGLALWAYAAIVRRPPRLNGRSTAWLVVGGLWALAFTLIAAAELHLPASLAAVLNATTPAFSALVMAVWLRERLDVSMAGGVGLGVFGVFVVVGWSPLPGGLDVALSVVASLVAALVYAIAGAYTVSTFDGVPFLDLAIGQQIAGAILLLPITIASGLPPHPIRFGDILAVGALSLVCTTWPFVAFYRLVAELGPTGALTVTFLVPLFGVLWGAALLGEGTSWSLVVGLATVIASIRLVTAAARPGPNEKTECR